jgi:hypothetical protein
MGIDTGVAGIGADSSPRPSTGRAAARTRRRIDAASGAKAARDCQGFAVNGEARV